MFVCVCVCVCVCACVCVCVRVGVRVGVTPTISPYRMSPASMTVNLNVKISVSDSWHLVEVAAFSPPSLSPLFLLLSPSLPLPFLPSLSVIPKPDEADNTTIIVVAVVLGIVALSLVGIFIVIALSLIK